MQQDLQIRISNGRGAGGKTYYYIRPKEKCYNRSRKISGFTSQEIQEKLAACISKWFFPKVILYKVDGRVIGSNSKENALKEYWRICDLADAKSKKQFEVTQSD
jgi:hypothetical protein